MGSITHRFKSKRTIFQRHPFACAFSPQRMAQENFNVVLPGADSRSAEGKRKVVRT